MKLSSSGMLGIVQFVPGRSFSDLDLEGTLGILNAFLASGMTMVKLSSVIGGEGVEFSAMIIARELATIASMFPVRFLVGLTLGLAGLELRSKFKLSDVTDLDVFVLGCDTAMLDCVALINGLVGLAPGLRTGDGGRTCFRIE